MAPLRKTQGFCIRRVDFSETSQVVTFYTRSEGLMRLVAKGSRRKKSATQGRIDLFACGEMVYIRKRPGTLNILAEFKLEELFDGLRRSLQQAYSAFYIAELLARGTHEGQGSSAFYDCCVGMLETLASGARADVSRMVFEAHFLDELGVVPQFGQCVECSGALPGRGMVGYAVPRGGPLCRECAADDAWQVPVGALGVVEGLRRASPAAAGRISIASRLKPFVRDILARCMGHAVELEPKMLRHLQDVRSY